MNHPTSGNAHEGETNAGQNENRCPPSSLASEFIRREIAAGGSISLARFMELALYGPGFGYYERRDRAIGHHGDFYTSVSVGSLFGELLAFQFVEWIEELAAANPKHSLEKIQILEAGAHNGQLACDILSWIQQVRPDWSDRIQYVILEPSEGRQPSQKTTLQPFLDRVSWRRSWPEAGGVRGVIFSNELLDAFPVHRFGWDARARRWFEWGVDWNQDRFRWVRLADAPSEEILPEIAMALLEHLPDGYVLERSAAGEAWWRAAASALWSGRLITVDYGFTSEERLVPERPSGTLRAYRQHRVTDDVLACPGEQDLTAHIDFSLLQRIGEQGGLATERLCRQAEFLVSVAQMTWLLGSRFVEWTPERRRQFQTLVHPEHLGRPFRVLVQRRAVIAPMIWVR